MKVQILILILRDWRDPSWTAANSTRGGLNIAERKQRNVLFDLNLIDIEGKSIVSLLVDEVISCAPFQHGAVQAYVGLCIGHPSLLRFPNR